MTEHKDFKILQWNIRIVKLVSNALLSLIWEHNPHTVPACDETMPQNLERLNKIKCPSFHIIMTA